MVINEDSHVSQPSIKHILFPIAPHSNFELVIEETARWAEKYSAAITVFCLKAGDRELPPDISRNMDKAMAYFATKNIEHTQTIKETKVYSIGYAKDIIKHAEENTFDLMAIMAKNSEENMYFGDVEKTNLLQNKLGIPVLCVND